MEKKVANPPQAAENQKLVAIDSSGESPHEMKKPMKKPIEEVLTILNKNT